MSQRRNVRHGAMMLVTTVTNHREPFFEDASFAREAVETLYRVKKLHPFFLYGFVIMPDHCHFLLCVPLTETISKIMNVYKSGLVHNIGLSKLWQPRYHLRFIDNLDVALRYVHMNPVRSGIVKTPEAYSWSSANDAWKVDTY